MKHAAGLALGLSLLLRCGPAGAAEQSFAVACMFDSSESGPDRIGTVADGLGGAGVSLLFDPANGTVRFASGSTLRLTKTDADSIEFQESEFTVTYNRASGDLISHNGKTGYDGTFHCARSR